MNKKWSACSKTCGTGFQRRIIVCRNGATNKNVNFVHCNKLTRPRTNQVCVNSVCTVAPTTPAPPIVGAWITGQWSACSKTCGPGKQTRSVSCNFPTCQGSEPESKRSCNIKHCPIGKFLVIICFIGHFVFSFVVCM